MQKKFLQILLIIGFTQYGTIDKLHASDDEPTLPPNPARLLLSAVRGGDYAHAGEEEAIDAVVKTAFALSPDLFNDPVLDVGCGFGGTVNYLHKQGFGPIEGYDIDPTAIAYAKQQYPPKQYPDMRFTEANALQIATHYPGAPFGFITLFNVAYAIPEKRELLKALRTVAKPGAILALFDYTCATEATKLEQVDLAGKPMYPLHVESLPFQEEGWEVLKTHDMTADYCRWYTSLLEKLSEQSESLKDRFSETTFQTSTQTFEYLLGKLKSGALGGAAVYARRKI